MNNCYRNPTLIDRSHSLLGDELGRVRGCVDCATDARSDEHLGSKNAEYLTEEGCKGIELDRDRQRI